MKIMSVLVLVFISASSFAQKAYTDPNKREKRGLLDPGEKEKGASSSSVPARPPDAPVPSLEKQEVDKDKARYCTCYSAAHVAKKRYELQNQLTNEKVMAYDYEKLSKYSQEAERATALTKKFSIIKKIDVEEVECEHPTVSASRPKDYSAILDKLSKECNFDYIEGIEL